MRASVVAGEDSKEPAPGGEARQGCEGPAAATIKWTLTGHGAPYRLKRWQFFNKVNTGTCPGIDWTS